MPTLDISRATLIKPDQTGTYQPEHFSKGREVAIQLKPERKNRFRKGSVNNNQYYDLSTRPRGRIRLQLRVTANETKPVDERLCPFNYTNIHRAWEFPQTP
jgi:hypothetical protein